MKEAYDYDDPENYGPYGRPPHLGTRPGGWRSTLSLAGILCGFALIWIFSNFWVALGVFIASDAVDQYYWKYIRNLFDNNLWQHKKNERVAESNYDQLNKRISQLEERVNKQNVY